MVLQIRWMQSLQTVGLCVLYDKIIVLHPEQKWLSSADMFLKIQ